MCHQFMEELSHSNVVYVTKRFMFEKNCDNDKGGAMQNSKFKSIYILDVATSSGILKAKQKVGRTFNSNKLGGIAFTKISKLTMCSA